MSIKVKLLTASFLVASIVGCATIPSIPDEAVQCRHIKDRSLDFAYMPDKVSHWYVQEYGVNVYLITTLAGKQIAINSLELYNYKCGPDIPK